MEVPSAPDAQSVRPGSYFAISFKRSAAAMESVQAHLDRLENRRIVSVAVELRDRAEVLQTYLRRVHPVQAQSFAAAVGSAITLDPSTTRASLDSTEEINLDPNAHTPRAPLWQGTSTSQGNVAGTYDGSLGTTGLTITVTNAGERGVSNAQVEVTDNSSPYKEKININKNDPLSEVYTLSIGLEFTFGLGSFDGGDTFSVDLQTGSDVKPDPNGTFDGSLGTDVNVETALPVSAGSFTVNGELITVAANDTINSVLSRINGSAAGVTASYDAGSELIALLQDTPGSVPSIVLGNDTSGFLAAMKLDTAVVTPGTDSELDRPIDQVPVLAGISSGNFLINGTSIAVDTSTDSVNDVIGAINASGAGVGAELVDNSYLRITRTSAGNLTLDSNSTGFFEALNISSGVFEGGVAGGRPPDFTLYKISRQTQLVVDRLNDLFDIPAHVSASSELQSGRSQIAALVSSEISEPLAALGLRVGIQYDNTGTRQSAFSDVNGSELRRGFRWRFAQLEALFAGPRGSGKTGALQKLIEMLDATVLKIQQPGALIDDFA